MKNFNAPITAGVFNIALFGPQGSGKGTQAEKLTALLNVPHISPGVIFRQAITDQSELGRQVEQFMQQGKLVPDDITNELMARRLQSADCVRGFILDGYPRNQNQDDFLRQATKITHAVAIAISDVEAVRRLSQRRACTRCGKTYHLEFKPPHVPDRCDDCNEILVQRNDDHPDSIKERLRIYHSQTEPLLTGYELLGVLYRVDGAGTIAEVWQRLQEIFPTPASQAYLFEDSLF